MSQYKSVTKNIMEFEALEPTRDQLKKINSFVPTGFPKLNRDQVRVINVRIADNLVNRGQSRWSLDSLQKMALMLPGKPALKNHDHYSIDSAWGRYFDAQYVASDEVDDSVLSFAGNLDDNQKIFDSEGYCAVYGQAFVAVDHSILSDIAFARVRENSLGGFKFREALCPECGISMRNVKCPHLLEGMYGHGDEPTVSHYIRDQLIDLAESSLVVVPNLPASGVA